MDALLPAGVWLTGPEQPLPQLSVVAGQDTGQRLVVVPPQLPSHRHPPSERLLLSPAEQPVVLHTPFTGGKAVQLLLVALPQLPAQLHGNVAEPVRQDAVFDAFALLPPEAALTGPEQLCSHCSSPASWRNSLMCKAACPSAPAWSNRGSPHPRSRRRGRK